MPFNVAVCQLAISDNKEQNIGQARNQILQASERGAQMVILPEMFNCPYDHEYFVAFAESYPDGPTVKMMSATAKEAGVVLVGGSIPERDGEEYYNTCFIFGSDGSLLGSQRKIHLFDVELETLVFKESDTLTRGSTFRVIDTPFCKVGVAICYDVRFPELARAFVMNKAALMVVPAAFNMFTGPAHWELLLRARAVDNQIYVVGASPARNPSARYVYYGHSMIVNPWGDITAKAGAREDIIMASVDLGYLQQVRRQLPVLEHRRTDLFELKIAENIS